MSDDTFVPNRRRAAAPAQSEPVQEEAPPAERRPAPQAPTAAAAAAPGGLRRGWSAAEQVAESTSSYAQIFKPGPQMQIIKFLEDSPYAAIAQHWVSRMTEKGPKKLPSTCLASLHPPRSCPLCEIGDRPGSATLFNVAVISDDGVPILRSWNVGVRPMQQIRNFHEDPKTGPITKGFYGITKAAASGSTINLSPIMSEASLENDYGVTPPDQSALDALGVYDSSVVDIPSEEDLSKIAAEVVSSNEYG